MDEVSLESGIGSTLDSLYAGRLALICGAGLSMAGPSSLPSAAVLARKAKTKYDETFGTSRLPLAESIDDQAQFFFERGELYTVYLRTYIDRHDFAAPPNAGHFAVADLLLISGITTAVSTNVDTLIEGAGDTLLGHIGAGISRAMVAAVPHNQCPLLKVHGCWSDPATTIWARGQVDAEPFRKRIHEAGRWLEVRLLDRDLLIVGYWTDWDYLNEVLRRALGAVTPSRVTADILPPISNSSRFLSPCWRPNWEGAGREKCQMRGQPPAAQSLNIKFRHKLLKVYIVPRKSSASNAPPPPTTAFFRERYHAASRCLTASARSAPS
jgi:hypothetical protein